MNIKNKFHTYLKKSTETEYDLSYFIDSVIPLSHWIWDINKVDVVELNPCLFEVHILPGTSSNEHLEIIAKRDPVLSSPGVAHQGILLIKGRTENNKTISIQIQDGGIGGKPNKKHFEDADGG